MIKKIFAVLLCLLMVVGCLAGCNNNVQNTTDPTDEVVATNPTDDATEPTDEVTDPTDDATEPSGDDETPAIDEKLAEVVTLAQDKLGEEFRASMEIPVEMYADMFGLAAETYEAVYGFMPMISAHVDTLVGVKATDVEAVKAALDAYVEAKKADRMQYPTNAAAMGAMQVVTVGDYVWLVGTFGATDTVAESGDEAILNYAKANVDKVVEIITNVCGE